MVYIIDKSIEHDFIEEILKILEIEYKYIDLDLEEFSDLASKKEYDGIFLPYSFNEYFSNNHERAFNKIYNCCDYISTKEGNIILKNSLYLGVSKFLEIEKLDLEQKTVLILGSCKKAISIYNAIKDVSNPVVYISTITDELDTKLRVGDRKIRKIEIMNILKSDFIINTTELGNCKAINTSMIEGSNMIPTHYAMDLLVYPLKTSFLSKYELKGAKIYEGLYLLIYRTLAVLGYKDFSKVYEIYNKIVERKINKYES